MTNHTDHGWGVSPHLLAMSTRVPESEHVGPVYDNGDCYADVAALRAQYAADGDPLPTEVWGCVEHTRVVALAI